MIASLASLGTRKGLPRAGTLKKLTKLQANEDRPAQALVEVIVAMGILTLMASAFARLSIGSYDGGRQAREQTKATAYTMRGYEAVRSIREQDFDNLSNGDHGFGTGGSVYAFSGKNSQFFSKFTLTGTVATLNRSEVSDEAGSGSVSDNYSKQLTTAVKWNVTNGRSNTVSFISYLTDWVHWRHLTDLLAHFTTGNENGTTTTSDDDGGATIGSLGDLETPSSFFTIDVPGSANIEHMDIDPIADRLYVSTDNSAQEKEFYSYDVSNTTAEVITLSGSTEIGANTLGTAVGAGHVYVLTGDNAGEVQVVRLSDYSVISTWDIPSNSDPNDIIIDTETNRAYIVTDKNNSEEFYILDISDPTVATIPTVSSVELGQNSMTISLYPTPEAGTPTHAFIGTDSGSEEIKIVDLNSLSTIETCNLVGTQDINDMSIDGAKLFLVRDKGANSEFIEFGIPVADPDNCTTLLATVNGETQLSDNANDMAVDSDLGFAFVIIKGTTNEIQVINLTTYVANEEDAIGKQCDSIGFLGSYIYAGCRDNSSTLQIIKGGAAGEEKIFAEGLHNDWTISNSGNATDTANTFPVRTDTYSLEIDPSNAGYTQFDKSFSTASGISLDFYINAVLPWNFGIYSHNGGTPNASTSVTNDNHGSVYATNDEEGAFTTFPTADFAAMKSLAQSTSSYINAGNSNHTLTTADLTTYAGKLIYVEFSNAARVLTVDLSGDSAGSFTGSIIAEGGKRMDVSGYNGAILETATGSYPLTQTGSQPASYPVLAADVNIVFTDNAPMHVEGFVFTQGEVDSSALAGSNYLTISGSIVATTVDTSLDQVRLEYATDLAAISIPLHFTPNYSAHNFSIQASTGDAVTVTGSYLTAGPDDDPTAWQLISIPLADMDIVDKSITYVRFTDNTGADQPPIYIDDLRWVQESPASNYPRWSTFTSPFFDTGKSAPTYQHIRGRQSTAGDISFRIRTADTEANLRHALWVGSGGTKATTYGENTWLNITLDPSRTGTKWVQWKAYLEGDGTQTPILEDVIITYE